MPGKGAVHDVYPRNRFGMVNALDFTDPYELPSIDEMRRQVKMHYKTYQDLPRLVFSDASYDVFYQAFCEGIGKPLGMVRWLHGCPIDIVGQVRDDRRS